MDPAVTAAAIKWEKAKLALAEAEMELQTTVSPDRQAIEAASKEIIKQRAAIRNAKKDLALTEKVTGTYYPNSDSWDDWWD